MTNPGVRFAATLLFFLFAACPGRPPEGSLVVPRGSTISVIVSESIAPSTHSSGSTFKAELSSPLSLGDTIVVTSGALVEGLVEIPDAGKDSTAVELRLTSLQITETSRLPISTKPMSRTASSTVTTEVIADATTGLKDKIRYLAETGETSAERGGEESDTGGAAVPRNSQLVFTLAEDLVVVPAG